MKYIAKLKFIFDFFFSHWKPLIETYNNISICVLLWVDILDLGYTQIYLCVSDHKIWNRNILKNK